MKPTFLNWGLGVLGLITYFIVPLITIFTKYDQFRDNIEIDLEHDGCANWETVMILLLTFPHSFSSYTLCMLLPHAYYFLFTFLFPSTDFLFFHAQPYCLCVASCTVRLLMHSPAQSAY